MLFFLLKSIHKFFWDTMEVYR